MYKVIGCKETNGIGTRWGVLDAENNEVIVAYDYYRSQAQMLADWLDEHPAYTELEFERARVDVRPSDIKYYTQPEYAHTVEGRPLKAAIVQERKEREAEIYLAFMACVMILATLGAALRFVFVHWAMP